VRFLRSHVRGHQCVAHKLQRPSADERRLYIFSSRWKDERMWPDPCKENGPQGGPLLWPVMPARAGIQ